MKKIYLLSALGLMLAGCANDDLGLKPGNNLGTSAPTNYLNISVVPTQGLTKADPAPGKYEDGTEDESKVSTVRFFFFDGGGNPFPVWENRQSGGYNSYLDWYPNSNDIDENGAPAETVETILKTTLGIITPSGAGNPSAVVAVLNPNAGVLQLNDESTFTNAGENGVTVFGPSLQVLQQQVADYYTDMHDKNFLMTNSVYVDKSEETPTVNVNVVATTLDPVKNFGTSPDGAGAPTPVEIYVERVLARVDFGISPDMTATEVKDDDGNVEFLMYSTGDPYMVDNTSTPIYVRFLGWNVTATTAQSRLLKSVNPEWTDASVFGSSTLWNTSDYHRSFWGMNPDGLTYQYGDFDGTANDDPETTNNYNPASLRTIADAGDYTIAYLQENANGYNADMTPQAPDEYTKVIIAAQLCRADGTPIDLAEWNYHKYEVDNMLTFLANNELNQLYWKTTSDTSTEYDKIDPKQLTFKTAAQLGLKTDDADYYVYVVLDDDAEDLTWALKGLDGNFTAFDSYEDVNNYIYDKIHHVRVWNNGNTYYYFDIKHLGAPESAGYYGIVRNHIYRSTVTKVQGLGTPVYDPDQVIIPEENVYDESIVTAEIKVLQWRVVENDYELSWK